MRKLIVFVLIVALLFSLSGCVEVSVVSDNHCEMYSRENTEIMSSSDNFGYGRSDDIYVALKYLYEDATIKGCCGDGFEMTPENVICHKSEAKSSWLKSNFKGEADYSFHVENVIYRIKLTKNYNEKWKVASCEQAKSE